MAAHRLQPCKDRDSVKVKVSQTRVVPNLTLEPTDVVQLGPEKTNGLYVVCHVFSVLELLQVQPATGFSSAISERVIPGP